MTPAARLRRIVGPRLDALVPQRPLRRVVGRRLAFGFGLLLAGVAALWGDSGPPPEARAWRGVDIVLCLDVSRSMLARDVDPARLVRAQQEIRELDEDGGGDRFGLVVFAGDARLIVPLTRDIRSLAALAELAGPSSVRRGGSDLGAAIEVASQALEGGPGSHGAIVLLTDGEDLEGRGRRAATACRAQGWSVHALGLGTPRGSKIALVDDEGARFVRDRAGAEVVSALDAASLEALTAAAGGVYEEARAAPGALAALLDRDVRPRAEAAHQAAVHEAGGAWTWLVLAAFLLWLLDLAAADRSRP